MFRVRTPMRVSVSRSPKRIAGGSTAWSPASLSNLVATISVAQARAAGLLFQNLAKTVAAVAHNDPVRVHVCPYTLVEAIAPSDAARPLLFDEGGGKWSLSFDGSDDGLSSSASATGATTIALRYTNLASGGGTVRLVRSGTVNALLHPRRTDTVPFFVNTGVRSAVWADDTATHTMVARKAGGGGFWTLRSDGSDLTLSNPSVSTDFGSVGLGVGGTGGPLETFTGRVASLLLYNANHTGADLAAMESYLASIL